MKANVSRKNWMVIGITTGVLALVLVVGGVLAQGPDGDDPVLTGGPGEAHAFTYQGYLEEDGQPANGLYDFTVDIWTSETTGDFVASCININTLDGLDNYPVEDGLFTFHLLCGPSYDNHDIFTGGTRWIEVGVRPDGGGPYTALPRQAISPTPYAWGLYPQTVISGNSWGYDFGQSILNIHNDNLLYQALDVQAASGTAVRSYTPGGTGVLGWTDDGFGVYGYDAGTAQARGYGGYFYSSNGVGVYGRSYGQSYYSNMYAPGVYGRSEHGAGVYGRSEATSWPAYGGYFEGQIGVAARSTGGTNYSAVFNNNDYRALYANGDTWYDAYFGGSTGIYAANYYSLLGDRLVAVNGGEENLQPGDVVAMAGVADGPRGEPVLVVQRADSSNAAAVIGVVAQAMQVEERELENQTYVDVRPVEGDVAPGQYLALITSGLATGVRVDSAAGALHIGDWVTVSSTPGAVTRAAAGQAGAFLGKVAGPPDLETGTVPIFVTLR